MLPNCVICRPPGVASPTIAPSLVGFGKLYKLIVKFNLEDGQWTINPLQFLSKALAKLIVAIKSIGFCSSISTCNEQVVYVRMSTCDST